MKADAYENASEGRHSIEINKIHLIDRFGIEAVTGRKQFFFGELRRMIAAENIVTAYHSRAQSKNWAEWSATNSALAEILAEAEKLCH